MRKRLIASIAAGIALILTAWLAPVQPASAVDIPPIIGYAKMGADDDLMVPLRAGCTQQFRTGSHSYDPPGHGYQHDFIIRVFYNRCPAATVVEAMVLRDTITGSNLAGHCWSSMPPAVVDAIKMDPGNLDGWNFGGVTWDCHGTPFVYRKVYDNINGVIITGNNDNVIASTWKVEWRPGSDASGSTTSVTVPEP
jgi:hypothetical protein